MADQPLAYWRLNENTAAPVADSRAHSCRQRNNLWKCLHQSAIPTRAQGDREVGQPTSACAVAGCLAVLTGFGSACTLLEAAVPTPSVASATSAVTSESASTPPGSSLMSPTVVQVGPTLLPMLVGVASITHGDVAVDASGTMVTRQDTETFLRTHQLLGARIGQVDPAEPASLERFDCRPWTIIRTVLASRVGSGDRYMDGLHDDDPVCVARLRGRFVFGNVASAPPVRCETAGLVIDGRNGTLLHEVVCSPLLDSAQFP